MRKFIVLLLVLTVAAAGGWWAMRSTSSDVAARVNNVEFPVAAVELFVAVAKQNKPDITRREVLDGLIENHLFATELSHAEHAEEGSGNVTYSRDTLTENELFKIIRSVYSGSIEAALITLGAKQVKDLYVTPVLIDADILTPLLSVRPGLYPVMTDDQLQAAKNLVVVRFRNADGSEQDVTLADIYTRQNIQLKVQLHNMNMEFLEQATSQVVATLFAINWFQNQSGLSVESVTAVERMVAERMQKEETLHALGMMQDIHDDNPKLRVLAESVSKEEINVYYQQHKDQFQRVEKVRARHIQLASQEKADEVFRALKEGLEFSSAVTQFSQAQDKDAPVPGDLGWIERADRHTHWLRSLAFVQPLQRASAPFRSPGAADSNVVWEIVFLDEKVMGYQPPDSEGVRYEASKAIAREKLLAEFDGVKKELWQGADIQYNHVWLGSEHGERASDE